MADRTSRKEHTKRWIVWALLLMISIVLSGCSDTDTSDKETLISTEETDFRVPETGVGETVGSEEKKVEIVDNIAFPEDIPEFGRLQWEQWLEAVEEESFITPGETISQDRNFALEIKNQINLIGQPVDSGNEEQMTAAKLLFKAVLRYAGVTWLNTSGTIGGEMDVRMYLINSTYNLDELSGEVLLQMGGENATPIWLEIVYEGSCRDQISNYRIYRYEASQPFYEVREALLFELVITTTNDIDWMYEALRALNIPDELNEEFGKFMDSETDPTTGELLYPARDYNGDGETDRFFKHANLGLYLVLSDGTVMTVDWKYTHLSDSRVVNCDLTGDGNEELIYLCRERTGQKIAIWEYVENEMRQIPVCTAGGEENEGVSEVKLSLIGEKVDNQHVRLIQPDSGKTYVFASDYLVYDMTYGYGVKEAEMFCSQVEIENDAKTGVAVLRMRGGNSSGACSIELSWEMRYEEGKLVPDKVELEVSQMHVEAGTVQIQPLGIKESAEVSDPIGEAEAAGVKLEKALWLELLERELIRFDEDRLWEDELLETGIGSYGRMFCVPWSPAETVEEKLTEVVQWDPIANGEDPSEWLAGSNLTVHAIVEAMLAEGYWSTVGSPENEGTLAAAETLIGVALKFAGEQYVDEAFSGNTWNVKIQLLEIGFEPERRQGVLLIEQEGREPLTVEVRGQGEGADVKYTVNEIALPEVVSAQIAVLTVKASIDTVSAMNWKYGVWDAFTHYEQENVCQIEYGELYAPEDCDGDGLPDRGFRYVVSENQVEFYWIMGSGEIVYVSERRGSATQELISVFTYDLTGDGVKEIICSKLRQQEGTYLQIFEWTEDGLQIMPFCYASGRQEDTAEMYKIDLDIMLQQVDDTLLRISQEECQKTIELTVDPKLMSSCGSKTPTVYQLISDSSYFKESDSGYILVAKGYIGRRDWEYKAEIVWEMAYEDGVWKVIDLYEKE